MDDAAFNRLRVNDMKDFLPKQWKHSEEYENKMYILVELENWNSEYRAVESLFSTTPLSIQRIQHPTAFLLYLIHKEYAEHTGSVHEVNHFMAINEDEVDTFLTHNCDRRYLPGCCHFLNTGSEAQDVRTHVIVMKKDVNSDNDKSIFPMYLVKFKN